MNALLRLEGIDMWQLAGWTMLHYLWLGMLAGLAAGALRLVLRRASANVRYVAALGCLTVLAALPLAIAVWVSAVPQAMQMQANSVPAPSAAPSAASSAPGSAGGLVDVMAPIRSMETTPSIDPAPLVAANTGSNPRQSRGLADFTANIARLLPWLWIVGAPLTFLLLATGVVGSERLRRSSRILHDGPIADARTRLVESLRIGRSVTVAICERIAAPMLVGILRPIILFPPAALTGWSPDEIEMVLLHELAHVRRWDNLVNLVQRLVEAFLFFHPAVWLVSSWVRREREACCDSVVVSRTNRPHAYAELLVNLAAHVGEPSEPGRPRPRSNAFRRGRGRPGSLVSSAMAAGPLRGRIRRILQLEDDPMLISGKSLGVVMSSLLLAATLIVLNLPSRTQAGESAAEGAEHAEKSSDRRASRPSMGFTVFHGVPLKVGASRFADGDSITITGIKGTSTMFEPGNVYQIHGTYTLASRDRATLGANVTAWNAAEGRSSGEVNQSMTIERGSGTFMLEMPMKIRGWPHVSFYPAEGGAGFGGVYFGTGDSVLKNWSEAYGSDDTRSETKGVAGTRRYGMGGNLPIEVSDEDGQRIVNELLKDPAVQTAKINRTTDGMQSLFVGIKEPAGKKAFLSWNTNSEGKLGCSIGFIETAGATIPAPSKAPQPVFDGFQSLGDQKFVEVPFVQGAASFQGGDKITILEVRGTAKTFKPGNIYSIKGTYQLRSHDRAKLAAYTTAKDAANGTSPSLSVQSTNVDRGEGTFTLYLPMSYRGWPHVSFYPADGGQSFGGVYFGTGDSVLKEWWDSKESGDSTTTRKFPSLEDQKLADLAYRRLGLELEPIGEDDLKRVKALGYSGGLKITQNDGSVISWETIRGGILPNDILVGLHVWPTSSLNEVVEILNRDDLAELNPLKFYIIRNGPKNGGGFGPDEMIDQLVTGRISVPPAGVTDVQPDRMPRPTSDYPTYTPPVLQPVQGLPVPTIPNAVEPVSKIPSTQPSMLQIEVDPREIALDPNLQGPRPDRWLAPPTLAAPAPDPLTESEKQLLKAAGGVRIEFFYHPESKPSTKAANSIPKYEKEFAGLAKVERINVAENPAAAKAANIDRVPAYVFYLGDRPVTGRTGEMTVEQLDSTLASIARHEAMEPTVSMVKQQPQLRYNGKTFDEWRTIWQTELSTGKRTEAVKALAAFGSSGQGTEATEAILEVVGQYDWPFDHLLLISNDSLQSACIAAFVSHDAEIMPRIAFSDALPVFLYALDHGGSVRQKAFMLQVLAQATDLPGTEVLDRLAQDHDGNVQAFAKQLQEAQRQQSQRSPEASKN